MINEKIDLDLMKNAIIIFSIITIIIISPNISQVEAHESDLVVKTATDVITYCEFYYQEFLFLGDTDFFILHPYAPNLRFCTILYDNIAWLSKHPNREQILVSEIVRLIGDSQHVKERHLGDFTSIPNWIRDSAKSWISGQEKDSTFAYSIRAMIKAELVIPPTFNMSLARNCQDDTICVMQSDFLKYSITDSLGKDVITEKYTIEEISSNQVKVSLQKISKESRDTIEFTLDMKGNFDVINKIYDKESIRCQPGSIPTTVNGVLGCQDTESGKKTNPIQHTTPQRFIYPIPLEIGMEFLGITNNMTVIEKISTSYENILRNAIIAENTSGDYSEIIDLNTGIILSARFDGFDILPIWEKTELIETNIFEKKTDKQYEDLNIPAWWKRPTQWLLDGRISDSEYIIALEYLIGKSILRV